MKKAENTHSHHQLASHFIFHTHFSNINEKQSQVHLFLGSSKQKNQLSDYIKRQKNLVFCILVFFLIVKTMLNLFFIVLYFNLIISSLQQGQ
jgi:hypothetical protein